MKRLASVGARRILDEIYYPHFEMSFNASPNSSRYSARGISLAPNRARWPVYVWQAIHGMPFSNMMPAKYAAADRHAVSNFEVEAKARLRIGTNVPVGNFDVRRMDCVPF